jgi:CRISPR-associated protein Cas6
MSAPETRPVPPASSTVDVLFALHAHSLPRDHASALARSMRALWPALASRPAAGLFHVKLVPGNGGQALLSRRARLTLRVDRSDVAALQSLAGARFRIGDDTLQLGDAQVRELLPHGTLFSAMVVDLSGAELPFLADVQTQLAQLGVSARTICGTERRLDDEGRLLCGFSLMLDRLSPADSLHIQTHGLGPARQLGCGLFIPHRSAAAVGG